MTTYDNKIWPNSIFGRNLDRVYVFLSTLNYISKQYDQASNLRYFLSSAPNSFINDIRWHWTNKIISRSTQTPPWQWLCYRHAKPQLRTRRSSSLMPAFHLPTLSTARAVRTKGSITTHGDEFGCAAGHVLHSEIEIWKLMKFVHSKKTESHSNITRRRPATESLDPTFSPAAVIPERLSGIAESEVCSVWLVCS